MGVLIADVAPLTSGLSNKVLVIASKKTVQAAVSSEVMKLSGLSVLSCADEAQFEAVIAERLAEIIIAIVDVSSCGAAVVDDLAKHTIPTIGLFNRNNDCPRINGKHVISCIDRDDIDQMAGLSTVIEGIFNNRQTRIIVLHQQSKYRNYLEELLLGRYYTVMQASDVAEAMELLTLYPDTQVLLLDENYTQVGNIKVIDTLRRSYMTDHLSIISLIAQRDAALISALFESGSSDVIATSTDDVEFVARVQHQASVISTFRKSKNQAFRDPLTEAYSMGYFWDVGPKIFANAARGKLNLAIAIVNIDSFSLLNKQYGAVVGNLVLCSLTKQLKGLIRGADFIVRKEGDEFICLMSCIDMTAFGVILERIRLQLESEGVWYGKVKIPLTVSIGATTEIGPSLNNMLARAEMALLQARKDGGNCSKIL